MQQWRQVVPCVTQHCALSRRVATSRSTRVSRGRAYSSAISYFTVTLSRCQLFINMVTLFGHQVRCTIHKGMFERTSFPFFFVVSITICQVSVFFINVFPMRVGHFSPPTCLRSNAAQHYSSICARCYSVLYFKLIAVTYILYFYLTSAGVVSNLAAMATVLLSAHPLCRCLALLMITTLSFSN
jgi:hypothetical protein